MKSIITVIAILLFSVNAMAQKIKESDVPASVKESFNKQFKNVTETEWTKEENGNYEVEFEMNVPNSDAANTKMKEVEQTATYAADGKFLELEEEMKAANLPKGVSDYIAKNMPGKKIKEACKITEANGTVMYEAEVGKEEFIFDAQGNFLKKGTEKEDDKVDDK